VEDHEPDAKLVLRVLKRLGSPVEVDRVSDGVEALLYLRQVEPYETAKRPDLILLDLNLPKFSGFEVLEWVKENEKLRTIPVVVLTGSEAQSDVQRAFSLHCNAYIIKPGSPHKFHLFAETLENFWFVLGRLP